MKTQVKTTCNRDCPDACSIVATVEDGRITQLAGDPDHACAEHGDFFHLESGHVLFLLIYWTRCQVWVRPNGPNEPRTSSFLPPSTGVRRRV